MARLKGREPKKPARADSGDGWALARYGTAPSIGISDWASRPHRIATSGPPRSTSASIARWVTCSQPLPRCEPDLPGWTVSTRFSSSTPWSNHGVRSPGCGRRDAEVGVQLGVDVLQAAGQRAYVRGHRERQADRVAGRGIGVLADDQHAYVAQRPAERAQHVLAGRQVAPTGRQLGPQEVTHRRDIARDRRQRRGPVRATSSARGFGLNRSPPYRPGRAGSAASARPARARRGCISAAPSPKAAG